MTRTLFSFHPLAKKNMVEVCVKFLYLFIHQTFIESWPCTQNGFDFATMLCWNICWLGIFPYPWWFGNDWTINPEKAMVPHSSTLAWKIPWMEDPGRLQSMGSLRVRHNWATSLSLFTFMHWKRKWQPTLVFLPGESQGRESLVGCHLWGHRVRVRHD